MSEMPIADESLERVKVLLRGWVRDLRVQVHEGQVVLRGTAFSYYAKQLAQNCFLVSLGIKTLVNEIEVRRALPAPNPDDTVSD